MSKEERERMSGSIKSLREESFLSFYSNKRNNYDDDDEDDDNNEESFLLPSASFSYLLSFFTIFTPSNLLLFSSE